MTWVWKDDRKDFIGMIFIHVFHLFREGLVWHIDNKGGDCASSGNRSIVSNPAFEIKGKIDLPELLSPSVVTSC